MSEIQAGGYVRYECGIIRKITRIIPVYENGLLLSNSYYIEFDNLGNTATYKNDYVEKIIKKHSKNIIDLIEVGDFVNGKLVIDIEKTKNGTIYVEFSEKDYISDTNVEKIKTILTKEQYNANCYKVVE